MSFRNEEKLKVASSKIFLLKDWIFENKGITIYPSRRIQLKNALPEIKMAVPCSYN